MEKRWLNIDEAAEYTTLAKGTLYNLVSRGEIAFVKLGTRKIAFDIRVLDAYMEAHTRQPTKHLEEKLAAAGVRVIPGGIFDRER